MLVSDEKDMSRNAFFVGFCGSCSLPLAQAVAAQVDGESFLFCNDACLQGYRRTSRLRHESAPEW
jgi:hypothetical protein